MQLRFDRGTLLFQDFPANFAAQQVAGAIWDPRVQAYRAPAHRYAEVAGLLRRRGIAVEQRVLDLRKTGPWAAISLRPYQQAALVAWELAGSAGITVLPTGAGKTRIALAALATARMSALCLVPTRALLTQWLEELRAVYSGPIGQLGDGVRSLAPVTVATFESAWRHMPRVGARFGVLVVDEVHHFGNAVRDEALEMCAAPLRLGLTATPPDEAALERLGPLVGPVVYQLGVGDLAGTYLADFDVVVLRLALDADERRHYDLEVRVFREVFRAYREACAAGSWHEFVAFASRTAQGRLALAAWRRSRAMLSLTRAKARAVHELLDRHKDGRVLVFTSDNAAAYTIAREHLLMPITCDIPRRERRQALEAFRKGELRALVSSRVLNEGIDVPDADVAIVVGGTHGEREHVQRIGRLLRPRPGKRATVYELVTAATSEVRQATNRRRGLAATGSAGL